MLYQHRLLIFTSLLCSTVNENDAVQQAARAYKVFTIARFSHVPATWRAFTEGQYVHKKRVPTNEYISDLDDIDNAW